MAQPVDQSQPSPALPIGHFYELDSLRGVAAAVVVLWHFTLAFPRPWLRRLTLQFPERLLVSGHQSVLLFFLLSGFVLTLPALRGRQPTYTIFVLKRILRIYLPYLGALALALAGDALLHGSVRSGTTLMATWANNTWTAPVDARLLRNQLLFLGNYNWGQVNTAFWSLVFELRISLLFPVLLWMVLSLRARWVILAAVLLSLVFRPLAAFTSPWLYLDPTGTSDSQTFVTLHYTAMFLLGSLAARNLAAISAIYARLTRWQVVALCLLSLLLYDGILGGHTLLDHTPLAHIPSRYMSSDLPHDLSSVAGALLVLLLSLHVEPLQKLLRHHLVHHLGKVSYSLYLVHGTVLFALMHLLPATSNLALLVAVYLASTLLLTELFYRLVEVPAIVASKRVGCRG